MTFEKLLTQYWPQTTLLLAVVAFFVKRVFDDKSKKIEVNHSLFQEKRIHAVNEFFSAYARVEFMFKNLAIYSILRHEMTEKKMDEIIWPPLEELKKTVLHLRIFFDSSDHKLFSQIFDNFMTVNNTLGILYFEPHPTSTVTTRVGEFSIIVEREKQKNNQLLDEIAILVKKTFNVK